MKKFKHYKNKKRSGIGFSLHLKINLVRKAILDLTAIFSDVNKDLAEYIKRNSIK